MNRELSLKADKATVDIFNLNAIECLEQLGLVFPTQDQINTVETFFRMILHRYWR